MRTGSRSVIYIAGLSHSGSTVLDMMLTTGGKAVGMGQIWRVLREDPAQRLTRVCSCGASAPNCPVWGPVIARLAEADAPAELSDRYELVLQSVARHCGAELAIIDSSKHASYLPIMAGEIPDLELKVLHNIKDVRAFTISALDNAKRKANKRLLPEKVFFQWYRDNRDSCAKATQVLGRPPHRVMYEGLCLATDRVAEDLKRVLGEPYIEAGAPLAFGQTHIISGNRLRLREEDKGKRLAYDYRWLSRSEWLRPYALMPRVRRYNEQCWRELTSDTG